LVIATSRTWTHWSAIPYRFAVCGNGSCKSSQCPITPPESFVFSRIVSGLGIGDRANDAFHRGDLGCFVAAKIIDRSRPTDARSALRAGGEGDKKNGHE